MKGVTRATRIATALLSPRSSPAFTTETPLSWYTVGSQASVE